MLPQFFVNAFSLGSFYALVALGFSIIFGVTHAFNLAHGELILLSGYMAYVFGKVLDLPLWMTLPLCMIAFLLAAVLLHRLLIQVGEPFELNTLVVAFGLALVLQNLMLYMFSADYRLVKSAAEPLRFSMLQLVVTRTQLLLISLSLLATTGVHLLLRKTFLGKALRATIQDRDTAKLAGINVEHMTLIAFALGGILIGLAGPLYARTAYLHPFGGKEATLIALIITIFAGVGRIRGILLGGWTLGIVESATVYTLGSSWREMVSALLLIVLLIWRPEGFIAEQTKLKS